MSNPVSDAIVAYHGFGSASWPQSNEGAIEPAVRNEVESMLAYARGLRPDWGRHDLNQAGEWAREQLASQFPYLTGEALDALVWSWTYGWK